MEKQIYESPLGEIILAAHGGALAGLWFKGQKYEQAGLGKLSGSEAEGQADKTVLAMAARWLDGYFAGEAQEVDFLVQPHGTAFQRRVWAALLEIPRGETLSYGALAQRLGCRSARAVGAAVGRNPVSVIIPCHRVLGSGGALTGYAGGIERKRTLLELEGVNII